MTPTAPLAAGLAAGLAFALAVLPAHGQPAGPGPGASAPGMGPGPGMGMGPGMHRGGPHHGGRWGTRYTMGWGMMSETERTEHRERMRSMNSHEECTAYMAQHREQMAARAKERGLAMPARPRRDGCAGLPAARKP